MSPKARSAPLARRLQAAKAEPTKPAALAPNPDRKPVAKPEPAPPPGPKPEPPPVVVPVPAPQATSEPPGPVPAPPAQPTASEPGSAAAAPALDPRAVLVRDFDWKHCPRPRSASPTCRRESRAAWGSSPTRTRTTTGGRPWHCGLRRGTFPWRYDWPVDDTVVSCQVALTPDGPTAVWLRLRPDRLPASRRMHEIYQVVYRVWERGRVEIGEYLAALIDAES